MFIAIRPFKQTEDKILIFDTSDISTEYISVSDFFANLKIKYIDMSLTLCGTPLLGWRDNDYIHWTSGIFNAIRAWDVNYEHGREYRFDQFCFSGFHRWEFGKFKVKLGFGGRFSHLLEVNDEPIPWSESFANSQQTPHYAFKYKDMLVLRFAYVTVSMSCKYPYTSVLTVILNRFGNVVSVYNDMGNIAGDKSIAMSVSMTCVF